ncbi:MAG: rep, partial [Clostridiaceae bacterium]|nr:rep [Clostridiaceae bacterium]
EEEEMRLFFVGITRAKDYLELSYYTNPDYKKVAPGESRYIRMIPEKLIENDEVKNESVNLQELKKQIQEARNTKKIDDAIIEKSKVSEEKSLDKKVNKKESVVNEIVKATSIKQVIHKKYGTGKVIKEDEMIIEVEFENYGVKEFIKAFSEFDFL